MDLARFGWCDFFAEAFRPFGQLGLAAARVAVQHRGAYEIYGPQGERTAEVSGKLRHHAAGASDFPVVGDWVAVEARADESRAIIHAVLPRQTKLSRTAAGEATEEQVLAANIDYVFIVVPLTGELKLRRIERYLTLAWESGAHPGVLLTKADLCPDVAAALISARNATPGAPVFALSSVTGAGMDELRPHLRAGTTAVLLGPSGAGKSTLINHLCGEAVQDVQPVREGDNKGRHTTSRRELICLPTGGMIIDTPGIRELQLWDSDAGLSEAFADIEDLAAGCQFTNCQHETEPGCAVRRAVETGSLEGARWESHRKLKRELAYFERRHDARAQAEARRRGKNGAKLLRAFKKVQE